MTWPGGCWLAPLEPADIDGVQALVAEAGWNQVAGDWQTFLALGEAFIIKAGEPAAIVASACVLPYAGGHGWISMVLVTRAWRRQGLATALMARCIEALKARGAVAVLDATPAGREVYRQLGFCDTWSLTRWRRVGPPVAGRPSVDRVRPMSPADWPGVLALDGRAFGCDRAALLARLQHRSAGLASVIERGGRIVACLLARDGRLATQLGPLVADRLDDAAAILAHASAHVPLAVVVDAVDDHAGWSEVLESLGFRAERPFSRMALDRRSLPGDRSSYFAVVGPEFG